MNALHRNLSPGQVSGILNAEVARLVRAGWFVQSQVSNQAILSKYKRIGWFWNTLLTLVTGGFWLIVVVYRVVNRKQLTRVITVNPDNGQIFVN